MSPGTSDFAPSALPKENDIEGRVWCSHGEAVGEYPNAIAALLTEDEIVALQEWAIANGCPSLAAKLRRYQLDAFVRWHG